MTLDQRGPFSFERPFYWSLQKLEILEKYASAATPILAKFRRVTFVDLMAGEAIYESGQLGSTGHFASIATTNREAGRQVRCIAYEADRRAFEMLEANTDAVREFVDARHGRWEDEVGNLLHDLEGDFTFFFVDPMGLRDIPWRSLEPLIRRPDSELLVNFASTTAARLAGRWRRNTRTAAGVAARLDQVYGNGSWLPTATDASIRTGEMHALLAREYGERIARVGGYIPVPAHSIRAAGAMGRPKYHLLFASRHRLALEIMNGVLAGQRERLRLEALAASSIVPLGQLALELDIESVEERARRLQVEHLGNSLAADISLHSTRTSLEALFKTAMWSRFGDYRRAVYREAATLLRDQGRLVVHEGREPPAPLQWSAIIEIPPSASR